MKKMLLVLGISATVLLTACGSKQTDSSSSTSSDISKVKLDTGIASLNEDNDTNLVTRKLKYPASEDGTNYTQTVVYQGENYITLTFDRISPVQEDLKNIIQSQGLEEAKRLVNESLDKDEVYTQAKTVRGFTSSVELLSENELKFSSSFDLQTLDLPAVDASSYFTNYNLRKILEVEPKEYIAAQIQNGAEEITP